MNLPINQIICGDNLEVMRGWDLSCMKDVIVLTDPPYGISHPTDYKSRGRGQVASPKDYAPIHGDDHEFNPEWLLKLKVPLILWGANYYANQLPVKSGWLVWDKKRPDNLDQSTCELAWTNCVKGVRRFSYLWNGCMKDGEQGVSIHPTQKPVALMKWCLSLRWTSHFKLIIDPYCGSGSTCVAAKQKGLNYIGIEMSPEYCEIAKRRLGKSIKREGFFDETQQST